MVKSEFGEIEVSIPRDGNGEYEPKLIPKHSRGIEGMEEKIISLYASGMSTRDIHAQIKELYNVEISAEHVSRITDRVLPLLQEWQSRLLETSYPFVSMDAIHDKVREEKQIVSKAAYVVLGINNEGYKEVLGIWIGQAESSKFWLYMGQHLKKKRCWRLKNAVRNGERNILPQLKAGNRTEIVWQRFSSLHLQYAKSFTQQMR